jgi:ribosomal protein S18 acetylase RimI-like enzyme
MDVAIAFERPDSPDAEALIRELEAHLSRRYPAESRHGFSARQLVEQGVDFLVLRADDRPAGCGGILFVTDDAEPYGEIKRMYVRDGFRGLGFGRRILTRLVEHAQARGVTLLRLETGVGQVEAIGLYESMGFRRCPPFGPYHDDPLSATYELRVAG